MKDLIDRIHDTEQKLKDAKNSHQFDKVVKFTKELEQLKSTCAQEIRQEVFVQGNLGDSVRHVVECMVYCNSAYKAAQAFENYLSDAGMYHSVLLKRVAKLKNDLHELTEYMIGQGGEPVLDFKNINDTVEVKIQYYLQNVIANEVQQRVVNRINKEQKS